MSGNANLPPGIYELLVDGSTDVLIDVLETSRHADIQYVDAADFPARAARHIGGKVEAALTRADAENRVLLANKILQALPLDESDLQLSSDRRELKSIYEKAPVSRPSTPLTETALLTNAAGTPNLQSELRLEMESADRVGLMQG